MKLKNIIVLILIILLIGAGVVISIYVNKHAKIEQTLELERSFVGKLNDSLSIIKTELGIIGLRYATLENINKDLKDDINWKNKTILTQQQTIVSLVGKLDSSNGDIITIGDTLIISVFNNAYSDSGVNISLKDSVVHKRSINNLQWIGTNYPEFGINLQMVNRIGRDANGVHFGAIEINSSLVRDVDVRTVFDSSYYSLPSSSSQKPKLPSTFALGINSSSQATGFGFLVSTGRWIWGVNYLTFVQTEKNLSWYDRLQGNIYWYIL